MHCHPSPPATTMLEANAKGTAHVRVSQLFPRAGITIAVRAFGLSCMSPPRRRFEDAWFGGALPIPACFHTQSRDLVNSGAKEKARGFYRNTMVLTDGPEKDKQARPSICPASYPDAARLNRTILNASHQDIRAHFPTVELSVLTDLECVR